MTLPGRRRAARRARAALLWLGLTILLSHVALSVGMERVFPQLRDPEYGRKLLRLREQIARNPGRPVVVALGSSRTGMGLRPDVIENDPEAVGPDGRKPVVFNFALLGSGPVMELLCLRRLLADGVRPDALVVEVWPPFLYEEGGQHEERRIDPNRLYRRDLDLLCRYSESPERLREEVRWSWWTAWYSHRFYLLSQVIPNWLPWENRRNAGWEGMDRFGWLPGLPDDPDPRRRRERLENARKFYQPILADFSVTPVADRALRELLRLCGREGIPVTLIVLPESSAFAGWYSDAGRARAEAYLADLRDDFGLPLIDARRWVDDARLPDGFHLTRAGAAEFSRRFGREVLPGLRLRENRP